MTDYSAVESQIESAGSLADIANAVSGYSASAVGSGGILYSGDVGNAAAHDIATGIVASNAANGVTVNFIDNTPRGLLLTGPGRKGRDSKFCAEHLHLSGHERHGSASGCSELPFWQ
jgi:hypothetical protein